MPHGECREYLPHHARVGLPIRTAVLFGVDNAYHVDVIPLNSHILLVTIKERYDIISLNNFVYIKTCLKDPEPHMEPPVISVPFSMAGQLLHGLPLTESQHVEGFGKVYKQCPSLSLTWLFFIMALFALFVPSSTPLFAQHIRNHNISNFTKYVIGIIS